MLPYLLPLLTFSMLSQPVLLLHVLLFFLNYLFKPLSEQILLLPANLVLSKDSDPYKTFLEAFESQLLLV